jgi:TonB family protein
MISAPDSTDIRERLHLGPHRHTQLDRPIFGTTLLDRRYRPFRGLVWSIVVHFSLVTAAISIPITHASVISENAKLREEAVIVDVDEFESALFLPILGVSDLPAKAPPEKKGLIYPGPQPISSNFANPTNEIQTILQPSLINPTRLQAPLVLPNIVRLAEPARLAPPPVENRFKMPDSTAPVTRPSLSTPVPFDVALNGPSRPLAAPSIESRFKLPEVTPISNPAMTLPMVPTNVTLATPNRPLAAPSIEPRFKMPELTPINNAASAVPTLPTNVALANTLTPLAPPPPKTPEARNGDAKQDLLVLSPTPAKPDQPIAVPPGEARGQFSISPDANLSFPGTEPGNRGTPAASPAPEPKVDVPVDRPTPTPNDSGTSTTTAAPGASRAFDPFEGITILGGIDTPASARTNKTNSPPEPLQTSYGITILASGGNGGGLPDFGVFGKEPVHTVYLDMRRTMFDTPLSWTAQYAVGQVAVVAPIENAGILALKEDVVLPFPIDKYRPDWPREIARRQIGRMVIAYAVINAEGTPEEIAIKDSPDPQLNEPVLEALRKWTFRPGRRDGQAVPSKMLLGIPVF